MKGVVIKYNSAKGFGFIRSEQHEKDVFVHIKNVKNSSDLCQGQFVEFEVQNTTKGIEALSVVAGRKQQSPFLLFGVSSAIIIFTVSAYLNLDQKFHLITAYLIAVNIATLIMYGYDKAIAGSGKLRIPEWNLHSLAIIGGSPTALVAQRLFRHKTIKGSFQLIYWSIVLVQGLGLWMISKS
jgi:uncharacterized membrane protein YsdA (DUF1294 family)/cold shock CspA family protein